MKDASPDAKRLPVAKLFEDRALFFENFAQRRDAFRETLENAAARRTAFDQERQRILDELESALSDEIATSRKALSEVAPIGPDDAARVPVTRAAYTDRMAALLAKLSMLAYIEFEDPEARPVLDATLELGGLKLVDVFIEQDTEAFVVEAERFLVVAFRGTTSSFDRKTDWRLSFNKVQVPGHRREVKVHKGFFEAFNLIAKPLHEKLATYAPHKPIYLTGHSLGGALALVGAAAFSGEDVLGPRIAAVYTFGAPRVGDHGYYMAVKAPHHRVVNQYDLIPHVPPSWASGYRHSSPPIGLRRNKLRPTHSRPWGSAFLLAILSILIWPFSRQLLVAKFHDIALYGSRLDAIAHERGEWS